MCARRYARLGRFPPQMQVVHKTDLGEIAEMLEEKRPRVAGIDSFHDLSGVTDDNGFNFSIGSGPGVTIAAKQLKKLADELQITIFGVAHVTKDGDIAGSNTMQHELDATLYMNGPRKTIDGRSVIFGEDRTLRCDGKNRFGVTGRAAYMKMLGDGLHDMGPWTHERPPWEVSVGERERIERESDNER